MTTTETKDIAETTISTGLAGKITISSQGNQVILDLKNTGSFSDREYKKIIKDIDNLYHKEIKPDKYLSISGQIDFYLNRKVLTPLLFRELEIITKFNGEPQSISKYQIEGDIKYIGLPKTRKNQDYLDQLHQSVVKFHLKNWRDNVIFYSEQLDVVVKTINRIQVISSILGVLTYIVGITSNVPRYQVMSGIPIILAFILTIIKRDLISS